MHQQAKNGFIRQAFLSRRVANPAILQGFFIPVKPPEKFEA